MAADCRAGGEGDQVMQRTVTTDIGGKVRLKTMRDRRGKWRAYFQFVEEPIQPFSEVVRGDLSNYATEREAMEAVIKFVDAATTVDDVLGAKP